MSRTAFCLVSLLVLTAITISQSFAEEWSQFRGPDGQAISRNKVPTTWAVDKNITWKTAMPGP
jgi:hypothetical protein